MHRNKQTDPQPQPTSQDNHVNADSQQMQHRREQAHPNCFVCEPHRPFGLRMAYELQADGSVHAHMACPKRWQGYPGMVHGGIIASILDGAMTHCLFARDIAAVTADLHVRYRHPLLVDADAIVTAKITREMAPVFVLEASIIQQDVIRCTATGKFMDRQFAMGEAMG